MAGVFAMTVHVLKLCVGIAHLAELEAYQAQHRARAKKHGTEPVNMHVTRNMPRRDTEVLDGGSLYWVIKGVIRARQPIVRLDDLTEELGRKACGIVLDPELIRVEPRPCRAFQGWRYLEVDRAPPDMGAAAAAIADDMPDSMQDELRALGLL